MGKLWNEKFQIQSLSYFHLEHILSFKNFQKKYLNLFKNLAILCKVFMYIITNILFALQLEGYHLWDFLVFIYKHPTFIFSKNSRQKITWTTKIQGIALLGGVLWISSFMIFFLLQEPLVKVMVFTILVLIFPIFIALSCILLMPVDLFLKR